MKLSRRAFATRAVATAGIAGVAGCLSDDGGIGGGGGNGGGSDGGFELSGEDALPPAVAGDPDADVTVMVFEDFSCPHCRSYQLDVYPQIESAYVDSEQIRYEHRDFPIPVDDTWSWAVAGAARSVQERGDDEAFWAFSSQVYEYQDSYSYDIVASVADEVGVDGLAVATDAEEGTYRDDLETERERASGAGVQGTPTIVVDGTIADDYELETVESAIEDALE